MYLEDAYQSCILVCIRTTLNLDNALMEEAGEYAAVKGKTALLHEGLRALIRQGAAVRSNPTGSGSNGAKLSPE